jgi:hypothetical protein
MMTSDTLDLKVLFLNTPELLSQHWKDVSKLLAPNMDAAKGDFDIHDLEAMVMSDRAYAGVAFENDVPVMGIVFAFRHYSTKMTINVLMLAGSNLAAIANGFWPAFLDWARQSGAVEIEACTRPAMSRVLGGMGFTHKYDVVKFELGVTQ